MPEYINLDEKPTEPYANFTIVNVDNTPYVFCPIRKRAYNVKNKPEEIVRQQLLYTLRDVYDYPFDQISVEVPIKVGSTEAKKAADVVVYTDKRKHTPRIIIEVKKPHRKEGIDQLQVYMNATACRLGLWTNGTDPNVYLLRIEPTTTGEKPEWRELRNIPSRTEELSDVDSPITRKDLSPAKDILSIVRECENYIKAHEGVNAFDEIFKLFFAKLYDERRNLKNDESPARFRIAALEEPSKARKRVTDLFTAAKSRWQGVFNPGEELLLGDHTLAYCISAIQRIYLLKSDVDVLGSAFEVMVNPAMKGDKGQYFTPRHVISLCVRVLQPQENETVLDPACGSGGFLVGTMDYVFKKIEAERDDLHEIMENQKDYASENVFGVDFDPLIAKVAKAYMLIWGDGRSNICIADGLNEKTWSSHAKDRLLEAGSHESDQLRQFDLVMMNPPFAGKITSPSILNGYELGFVETNGKKVRARAVDRDILFLERGIRFLKPGGRMAIIIPRGLLKNYGDENVREYLIKNASIRAVVSLTGLMFKPFTNTKTCILFAQKRIEPLTSSSEAIDDPPIHYAVSQQPGKDRSGKLIRASDGTIQSDLDSIATYLEKVIDWTM